MQKYLWDLCRELALAFCSTQLSTHVLSLTSKKCCHVGIHVILGTPCKRTLSSNVSGESFENLQYHLTKKGKACQARWMNWNKLKTNSSKKVSKRFPMWASEDVSKKCIANYLFDPTNICGCFIHVMTYLSKYGHVFINWTLWWL